MLTPCKKRRKSDTIKKSTGVDNQSVIELTFDGHASVNAVPQSTVRAVAMWRRVIVTCDLRQDAAVRRLTNATAVEKRLQSMRSKCHSNSSYLLRSRPAAVHKDITTDYVNAGTISSVCFVQCLFSNRFSFEHVQ